MFSKHSTTLNYNFAFHNCDLTRMAPEKCPCRAQDGESRELCRVSESIGCFVAPKVLKIKSVSVSSVTLWHSSRRDSRGDYWIILSWDLKTFWFKAPRLQRRHRDPVKALRMLQCFIAWSSPHLSCYLLIFPEFSLGFLHFVGLNSRTLGFSEELENRGSVYVLFNIFWKYLNTYIGHI